MRAPVSMQLPAADLMSQVQGQSVSEILEIDVKPGWKQGTKITFPQKGERCSSWCFFAGLHWLNSCSQTQTRHAVEMDRHARRSRLSAPAAASLMHMLVVQTVTHWLLLLYTLHQVTPDACGGSQVNQSLCCCRPCRRRAAGRRAG